MGVEQAGTGRAGRDAEGLGDLGRGVPEEVMEHEDRPLLGRETPEPALQQVAIGDRQELVGGGRSVDRQHPPVRGPGEGAAFLEEGSARREAERGTFDPGYGSYALGKLMLMKLRRDVKERQGQRFSLKAFHDNVLGLGGMRFPLQREALLGREEAGGLLE